MTVQAGLCRTCSETTLLVFPRGGSYFCDTSHKFQDSGVGAIGLGGKSAWDVDDEMQEIREEGKSTVKHLATKLPIATGENNGRERFQGLT